MLAAAVHERRKDQIDSEDARQHRRATLFGRGIIAVLTALLLIAGVGWYNANVQRHDAEQQRSVAEQQRDLATGREMEAEAENLATTQPQTSLQLSLAALRIDPTTQVRATLVNTLLQTHYDGSSPPQDPNGLGGTAVFSPDGRMLAAITGQNHAVLWNTTDPTHPVRIGVLPAGSTTFASGGIKFSPDSRLLAIASAGNTVILWNVAGPPRRVATVTVPDPSDVAFSPDGKTLAIVGGNSGNGTLALWEIGNPAAPARLATATGVYFPDAVAFSPDGRLLVTASGTITFSNSGAVTHRTGTTLWDVSNLRSRIPSPTCPCGMGTAASLSVPTAASLLCPRAARAPCGTSRIPRNPQLVTLTGQTQGIEAMAFSPDGRTLATAGQDNNGILWNTADPAHATRSAVLARRQPVHRRSRVHRRGPDAGHGGPQHGSHPVARGQRPAITGGHLDRRLGRGERGGRQPGQPDGGDGELWPVRDPLGRGQSGPAGGTCPAVHGCGSGELCRVGPRAARSSPPGAGTAR